MVDRLMHPFQALKRGVSKLGDMFGKMFGISDFSGKLADKAKDILKSILRKILPTGEGMSIGGLTSKVIPDKIYKFAGVNKATGELLPEADPAIDKTADPERVKKALKWRQAALAKGEHKKVANIDKGLKEMNYDPSKLEQPKAKGSNKMADDLIAMGYSKEAAEKTAFIQQGGMSPTVVKSPATKQSQLAQAYVDDTAQRRAAEDKQTNIVPVSNVSDNSTTNSNMTVVNNNAFPQQGQVHDF